MTNLMTTLPNHVIGDAYTSTTPWNILEDLVQIGGRMAGSQGEKRGAKIIENAFRDLGLRNIKKSEFEIQGWRRGSTRLKITTKDSRTFQQPHEIIAYPLTEPCDIITDIVDVGYGTPEEINNAATEDSLVMARNSVPNTYDRSVSRMEKYVRVMDAGASGFIFRNTAKGGLPPTSTAPGTIPNVGVSREVGAHLVRYCKKNSPTAHLTVESQTGTSTSQNVSAVVGPQTDEEIIVSAHIDSHDISDGARDNGVGCAIVVEVGRLLKAMEEDLDTQVRLITFGAEEFGLFGAHQWAKTHNHDKVVCLINVDAAGNSRTLEVQTNEFKEITEVFESVTDSLQLPMEKKGGIGTGTDAWAFAQKGIPAVTAASSSREITHTEVERGRGWGHTHADTIDKLDRRDLRDLCVSITGATVELADKKKSISHLSPSEVKSEVNEPIKSTLRALGRWPSA